MRLQQDEIDERLHQRDFSIARSARANRFGFTIAQVCHDGSRPTGSLLSTEDGMMRLGRLFGMSRP